MSERAGERETGERLIRRHLQEAHEHVRGERQLAEYVARLDIGECARILAESPVGLPTLAALRDECRVRRDERRGFEAVIRTWTLQVLSGAEGG